MSRRRRPWIVLMIVLAIGWALVLAGFGVARHLKTTPEKVRAFLHQVDLARLTGPERAKALRRLAAMMNALSLEERREVRRDSEMSKWFAAMSVSEKEEFMEATLPTGFQQMMTAFEQLPPEKRRKAIEDAVRRMKEQRESLAAAPEGDTGAADPNRPAEMPPELREKAVKLGLKTFYDSGSPQMKAELAPVLEEMQLSMESGRLFREPRGRRPEN